MRMTLSLLLGLLLSFGQPSAHADDAEAVTITVNKSPTCGCCKLWIEHLRAEGFLVEALDSDDMTAVKKRYEVPQNMQSCHTAVVDGYVIEGHVPAADIRRLLAEAPDANGLAVPGMPVGSPGMEYGDRVDPYKVMLFDRDTFSVFSSYGETADEHEDSSEHDAAHHDHDAS